MLKKFIAGLVIAGSLFFCTPAIAVNSATQDAQLPINIGNAEGRVIPVTVIIDTIDTDLIVFSPASDAMACITGLLFSESTSLDLTFKSASTTQVILELAKNQGIAQPLGTEFLMCTDLGEDLTIASSKAINFMLFYVLETERLNLD